jgi:Flp pilus assembly pilin Flp
MSLKGGNNVSAAKPLKIDWRQWRERGQGLVEYAMILAMIAIVILAILTYLGTVVQVNLYSKIGSGMGAIVQ